MRECFHLQFNIGGLLYFDVDKRLQLIESLATKVAQRIKYNAPDDVAEIAVFSCESFGCTAQKNGCQDVTCLFAIELKK